MEIPSTVIVAAAISLENNKNYPKIFCAKYKCLYKV